MPKLPSVELRLLRPYPGLDVPVGEAAFFESTFADKLILGDYAEFVKDEFDRVIEDCFRKYPQAIANLTAYADREMKEGRCEE
jgi:hypothetical protein